MEVIIDDAYEFANTKRIEFYQVSPKDESFPSLIKSLGERIYARIEKSEISLKPGNGIMQTAENKDKPNIRLTLQYKILFAFQNNWPIILLKKSSK